MTAGFEVVPYTLRTRVPLNARTSRRAYEGALVRCRGGYGCVHPWPELGDRPLKDELQALARAEHTPLTRATSSCLELDGEARRAQRWLFAGGPRPPKSHATLTDLSIASVEHVAARGFEIAKVKAGPSQLKALTALLEVSPLPLRIDFNETMTLEGLHRWHGTLNDHALETIDFIEDPCPYEARIWEHLAASTGWRLALDRNASRATGGFHILVHKPAVDVLADLEAQLETSPCSFLVTSSMDHPLGQLHAAYVAAQLTARYPERALIAGLATHHLFESLPETLDLGNGPSLRLPEGTGLGLDDYLESLPWRPLRL